MTRKKKELTVDEAARVAGVVPGELLRWLADGIPVSVDHDARRRLKFRKVAYPGSWGYRYLVDAADLTEVVALRARRREARREPSGVLATEYGYSSNGNRKLGACNATYVAAQSCPDDCAFRGSGCYAEFNNTGHHWRRITDGNEHLSPLDLARTEAKLILNLMPKLPLRLHVAGDSKTRAGTRVLATAAAAYTAKTGQPVFTYTHAWRVVPRKDWGSVSVLASCETPGDVRRAWKRGYAASVVDLYYDTYKAHDWDGTGIKVIPCPAQQFPDVTCASCRMCMDDRRLQEGKLVIGFETHGAGRNKAGTALRRVSLPTVAG